jgi:hypothetical protein
LMFSLRFSYEIRWRPQRVATCEGATFLGASTKRRLTRQQIMP